MDKENLIKTANKLFENEKSAGRVSPKIHEEWRNDYDLTKMIERVSDRSKEILNAKGVDKNLTDLTKLVSAQGIKDFINLKPGELEKLETIKDFVKENKMNLKALTKDEFKCLQPIEVESNILNKKGADPKISVTIKNLHVFNDATMEAVNVNVTSKNLSHKDEVKELKVISDKFNLELDDKMLPLDISIDRGKVYYQIGRENIFSSFDDKGNIRHSADKNVDYSKLSIEQKDKYSAEHKAFKDIIIKQIEEGRPLTNEEIINHMHDSKVAFVEKHYQNLGDKTYAKDSKGVDASKEIQDGYLKTFESLNEEFSKGMRLKDMPLIDYLKELKSPENTGNELGR